MPGRTGLKIHAECCASLPTACPAQPWLVGLACIPHRQLSLQLLVCWPPLLTCLVALHSDTPHCHQSGLAALLGSCAATSAGSSGGTHYWTDLTCIGEDCSQDCWAQMPAPSTSKQRRAPLPFPLTLAFCWQQARHSCTRPCYPLYTVCFPAGGWSRTSASNARCGTTPSCTCRQVRACCLLAVCTVLGTAQAACNCCCAAAPYTCHRCCCCYQPRGSSSSLRGPRSPPPPPTPTPHTHIRPPHTFNHTTGDSTPRRSTTSLTAGTS